MRRIRDSIDQVTVTLGGGPIKAEVSPTRPALLDRAVGALRLAPTAPSTHDPKDG